MRSVLPFSFSSFYFLNIYTVLSVIALNELLLSLLLDQEFFEGRILLLGSSVNTELCEMNTKDVIREISTPPLDFVNTGLCAFQCTLKSSKPNQSYNHRNILKFSVIISVSMIF